MDRKNKSHSTKILKQKIVKKEDIRTIASLAKQGLITTEEINVLQPVVDQFALAMTHDMQTLIDRTQVPHDPIAKQFIPSINELIIAAEERDDPIGDQLFSPVKGIVHRHADRCLLMPAQICAVYCRFCFRREKIGSHAETLTPAQLTAALDYIAQHSEIWEVILTGGDPLILKPMMLAEIMQRLAAIPHVEVVRIHTRIPVVDPERIHVDLIAALKLMQPVYVILHANHPKELTEQARAACARLIDAGIPMLSQSVLLKEVNDDIETLSALMRSFIKNRIKPYYLHQGDLAKGTQHFRTTIAHGQQLIAQLRARFSGLCQPTYVLDIPGGYGKVPIGPCYVQQVVCHAEGEHVEGKSEHAYVITDYDGNLHQL